MLRLRPTTAAGLVLAASISLAGPGASAAGRAPASAASAAPAGAPDARFVASWRAARHAFRHGEPARAYRRIRPLVPQVGRLGRASQRWLLLSDAAEMACVAGAHAQARAAARAVESHTRGWSAAEVAAADRAFAWIGSDRGSKAASIALIEMPDGDVEYRARGDYVDGAGRRVDFDRDGRVDEERWFDVDFRVVRGTMAARRLPRGWFNGWAADPGCRQGASVKGVPGRIVVRRSGGARVPLRCTWAVRCTTTVTLAKDGRVLARGRWTAAPGRRATAKLRLTSAGRTYLRERARVRGAVLASERAPGVGDSRRATLVVRR